MAATDKREASDHPQTCLKSESLTAVYDSILIPALTLVEMERQKGELEESTVRFIRSSTSEMVDELGFRALEEKNESAQTASNSADPTRAANTGIFSNPASVVVVPVRDGFDELIAIMLAQVLDQSGFH